MQFNFKLFSLLVKEETCDLSGCKFLAGEVSDIKYTRGSGFVSRETINDVEISFSSYSYPESAGYTIYLPGADLSKDGSFVLGRMISSIFLNTPKRDGFTYEVRGMSFECKEVVCDQLVSYHVNSFQIQRKLTPSERAKIKKWTIFAPVKVSGRKVEMGDWWFQGEAATKIGWLLLALRVVTGDYFLKGLLKEKFVQFIEDERFRSDLPKMSGKDNWISRFNK